MNLTELSKQVHAAAKANGFWEGERNVGEIFMLIISEAAEALEAHRKGKFADLQGYEGERKSVADSLLFHIRGFEKYIKDSFEDELADVVIRVLDYAGSRDLDVSIIEGNIEDLSLETNIGAMLCDTCEYIIQARLSVEYKATDKKVSANLRQVLRQVFAIAKFSNIDLERHIELKLKYNKTRPYKHGKNY